MGVRGGGQARRGEGPARRGPGRRGARGTAASPLFSRPLPGGCRVTQQAHCLLEPRVAQIGSGKEADPSHSLGPQRPHGSLLPLPCRVLAEGSGRQREVHVDCAVRARPLWALTPTTSAAWELAAFLAASPRLAGRPVTD